jgi:hypothetical protein
MIEEGPEHMEPLFVQKFMHTARDLPETKQDLRSTGARSASRRRSLHNDGGVSRP